MSNLIDQIRGDVQDKTDKSRRRLAHVISVAGVSLLILALWVMVLPIQLSHERTAGLAGLSRWRGDSSGDDLTTVTRKLRDQTEKTRIRIDAVLSLDKNQAAGNIQPTSKISGDQNQNKPLINADDLARRLEAAAARKTQ